MASEVKEVKEQAVDCWCALSWFSVIAFQLEGFVCCNRNKQKPFIAITMPWFTSSS